MQVGSLLKRALNKEFLSAEEGEFLFHNAATAELMFVGNELKKQQKKHEKVTWIIDRNLNTTNVCIANCKFCNFFRVPGHAEAYVTTMDEYKVKIEETIKYGGNQLLLQGGHHPDLGLKFYCDTFKGIKEMFPDIKTTRNCSYFEVRRGFSYRSIDCIERSWYEFIARSWSRNIRR